LDGGEFAERTEGNYRRRERWIRALDLVLCVLALPTLLPLILLFGLAIKLTSPGPVFYHARRVGQHGKIFFLLKFRSMYLNADRMGPGITVQNDPRVTSIGRLLRRAKLDELPQIFNVLWGDMSIVGPRPEDPRYVEHYKPVERQLLSVRPGITSVASLYYSAEETLLHGEDWERAYLEQILPHKLALDAAYVQEYSVRSYLAIIFASVVKLTGLPKLVEVLTHHIRNRHIFAADLALWAITPIVAWCLLNNQLYLPSAVDSRLVLYMVVATLVKVSVYYGFGLYRRYWQYTGIHDLALLAGANGTITGCLAFGYLVIAQFGLLPTLSIIPTLPIVDGLLSGVVSGSTRLGMRMLNEWMRAHHEFGNRQRVIIAGAGSAGIAALREIRMTPALGMNVIAFLDDDDAKIGTRLHGIPVVGPLAKLEDCLQKYHAEQLVITLPPRSHRSSEEIADICTRCGTKVVEVPAIHELLAGHKIVSDEPRIDIDRLLRRKPVQTDDAAIGSFLTGKIVLITGAGGSIGSELCRQIAHHNPERLLLLGHGENSIFEIGLELRAIFPALQIEQIIADVRDTLRIDQLVAQYRPHVIYHAAAHKHVPLMQRRIEEAIQNNVLGTRNVLRAAERYDVPHFVLISTDKAIKPTSIMGATKRLAELLVQVAALRTGRAYQAVRFGNVLGSRGSVIPIFRRQIAAGGPVTVTHPEMTRYFMTIPEAVQLVLQATVLGQGGEVFVLDMGEPVRILDLAIGLIEMAGIDRQTMDIVFSGVRPGEKLHEELFLEAEHATRTVHEKIFVATPALPLDECTTEAAIGEIISQAQALHSSTVLAQINALLKIQITIAEEPSVQPPEPAVASAAAPVSNGQWQLSPSASG